MEQLYRKIEFNYVHKFEIFRNPVKLGSKCQDTRSYMIVECDN